MSDEKTSAPKLMVIGIDGATWDLARPWMDAGELPNIASVVADGCSSDLQSVLPPVTACAWPTAMTGTNPGKHGLFGFMSYNSDAATRPMSNLDRRTPAIWELAAEQGLSVGVFNVPMTYPPDQVNGYMVSGEMGAAQYDTNLFHPRNLFEEAQVAVPGYNITSVSRRMGEAYSTDHLRRSVASRQELACYLLDNHPTDVFIAVINYVDHLQHGFFQNRSCDEIEDVLRWAYRKADEFVGAALARADEETAVLLLSDHGFGPMAGLLDVTGLLTQLGYMHYREARQMSRPGLAAMYALRSVYRRLIKPRMSAVRRRRASSRLAPLRLGKEVDWERVRAFALPGSFIGIRINLRGREPNGTVAPEDFKRVRDELIADLNAVENPFTGECDLGAVAAEDVYHGDAVEHAPDILGMGQGFALNVCNTGEATPEVFRLTDDLPADHPHRVLEGTHRINGIFAARLPGEKARLAVENPQLADIAPTALAMLGLPVPTRMDGRVARELPDVRISDEAPTQRPAAGDMRAYSDEDEKRVEDNLRNLGYL